MRTKTLVVIVLLSVMPTANACINTVGTDHQGRRFWPNDYVGKDVVDGFTKPHAQRYWLKQASYVIKQARTKPDFENLTDLGIVLVYQGQFALAVRHFLTLEQRFPGHHETAANLGTALELAGHDAVALKWIGIGIQRNRQEHFGSEWLHTRILETKIALAKDPHYLKGRSIAGVVFERALVPALPSAMPSGNDGKPVKPWELNSALAYQLHERTGFVRPTDPAVANLLLDWATLNLAGGPIETADAVYDLAVTYGAERDALMRNRQSYIKRVLSQAGKAKANGGACRICAPMPPPPPPPPVRA